MNISADVLIAVIFIISVLIGMSRGFAAAGKNMISTVLVIILMVCLTTPVSNLLLSTPLADTISRSVEKSVYNTFEEYSATAGAETIINNLGLPKFISDQLLSQTDRFAVTEESIAQSITQSLTSIVLKGITSISIFVVAQLIVMIIFFFLRELLQIPVFEKLDTFMGFVMGAVNALLIIYILCGLLMLFTPIDKQQTVNSFISTTYVVKYFYNNNYLLKLFI